MVAGNSTRSRIADPRVHTSHSSYDMPMSSTSDGDSVPGREAEADEPGVRRPLEVEVAARAR
jgi:hypothetical protein